MWLTGRLAEGAGAEAEGPGGRDRGISRQAGLAHRFRHADWALKNCPEFAGGWLKSRAGGAPSYVHLGQKA
jgi:hypothetical protein